jgi:hypothetical protein
MLKLRGVLKAEEYPDQPVRDKRAPKGGGGRKRAMGMRAAVPKKKGRTGAGREEQEEILDDPMGEGLPDPADPDFPDPADPDFPDPADADFPDPADVPDPEDINEPEAGLFDFYDDFDDFVDQAKAQGPCGSGDCDEDIENEREPGPFADVVLDVPESSSVSVRSTPKGWFCQLLGRYIGRAVTAPPWYMRKESHAVHQGTQTGATCGLHAVNHALHPLGKHFTLEEFERNSLPDERAAPRDSEFATLHRNVMAAGAFLEPVLPERCEDLSRWNPEESRLTLWSTMTHGCVMHVPGHWVCLTRCEGPQTAGAAALLCDSLHREPFALSAEEVGELFALVACHQQTAPVQLAGTWSLYVVI